MTTNDDLYLQRPVLFIVTLAHRILCWMVAFVWSAWVPNTTMRPPNYARRAMIRVDLAVAQVDILV